jgi:hypothetical protein
VEGVRIMATFRRHETQQQGFQCGYCHKPVRVTAARLATVRNQVLYVHKWHPVRPGEGRLLR